MKQLFATLLIALFILPFSGNAQTWGEDFTSTTNRTTYTTSYGYVFSSSTISNASASRINGNTVFTSPYTQSSTTQFSSGYLYLDGSTRTITFNHRNVSGNFNFQPSLFVQLRDTAGNLLTPFFSYTYVNNSLQNHTATLTQGTYTAGWYRVVFRWNNKLTGNGNNRALLDDISSTIASVSVTGKSTNLSDLRVTSFGTPGTIGDNNTFVEFNFTNHGPDASEAVVATLTSNAVLNLTGAIFSTSNLSFNATTRKISINSLSKGNTASLMIRFNRTNPANMQVTVDAPQYVNRFDPQLTNNTASYLEFITLSVKLTSFSVEKKDAQSVLVKWTAENYKDIRSAVVERSVDGTHFTAVSEQLAVRVQSQSYLHRAAQQGTVFYRVKFEEWNGTISYSGVEKVQFAVAQESLRMYPNPAIATVNVVVTDANNTLTITSLGGQTLLTRQLATAGQHTINIQSLPQGNYVVTVQGNGKKQTQMLVKK